MDNTRSVILTGVIILAGTAMYTSIVHAKPPRSDAQVAEEQKLLLQAVAKGDALWHNPKLGTNGLACGNCHPDGSASNPQTFPKYQSNLGKVGTLREMINWCITVPMQGQPLPVDSDEMISMEAYSTYTHRGFPIAPAADKQFGAVPVTSGPGYPSQ